MVRAWKMTASVINTSALLLCMECISRGRAGLPAGTWVDGNSQLVPVDAAAAAERQLPVGDAPLPQATVPCRASEPYDLLQRVIRAATPTPQLSPCTPVPYVMILQMLPCMPSCEQVWQSTFVHVSMKLAWSSTCERANRTAV